MLYRFLKVLARLGYPLYVKDTRILDRDALNMKGPLLLACNHPNSFLDAIIICTLFNEPVYSLARGDAFKKDWAKNLLHQLNIYPVYRLREGAENLVENYATFDICRDIFRKNGIVLIFSEALCENEWHLRPLKKGTARLALSSWEEGIDVKVLPVGLNYSSFKRFGKSMDIRFGKVIDRTVMDGCNSDGQVLVKFNKELRSQLENLVLEFNENDKTGIRAHFERPAPAWKKILLGLPALAGLLIHWPLFAAWNRTAGKKSYHTGHYDSVIVGGLFLVYPFFILIITIAVLAITQNLWSLLCLIIIPFTLWSLMRLRQATAP